MNVLLVMAGGALGAAARYGTALLSVRLFGSRFPAGTLAANLAGCLLIGLLLGLAGRTALLSPAARLFLVTGFLGGLTTFSSYAWETVVAADGGGASLALANILANNLLGLALALAGLRLARLLA